MRVKDGKYKKWITLFIICLTTATITELPYLRWALYEPLRQALGLTNTQFGMSMSLFGLVAMVTYLPGGWLADRFSHRKLFALSSIGCGILGLWFATLPDFKTTMIIHFLWALTNIFMFWPVMLKAVSVLGSKEEQGKFYGLFEGIRGVVIAGIMFVMLEIFRKFGEGPEAVSAVIIFLAIGSIACGILAWFFMEDNNSEEEVSKNSVVKDLIKVIKMPTAWLCSGVIFTVYSAYSASSYMNPYMQEVFGVSALVAGYLTMIRKDIIRIFAAPLSGIIATKMGGACTKIIGFFATLMILSIVGMLLLPGNSSMLWAAVALSLISSVAVYGMRGLYYATIGEIGTPKNIYGAVAGFACVIGFSPDIFNSTLIGYWMDTFPGITGYKIIFSYMIGTLVLCLILVMILLKLIAKNKAKNSQITTEDVAN